MHETGMKENSDKAANPAVKYESGGGQTTFVVHDIDPIMEAVTHAILHRCTSIERNTMSATEATPRLFERA